MHSIKELVRELTSISDQKVLAFIDLHGHSRKKSVFIYGPYFPLHSERYLRMRILPKLLSERTNMFRYFACKFRNERSKRKAARLILCKEFNLMNSFTCEASFHGYMDEERRTVEFLTSHYLKMGRILGSTFYEYKLIVEADEER